MVMAVSGPVDGTGTPNVRLDLPNRPENVVLVRQVLAGLAEAVGVQASELNDISTAVTEACNNVVLHAYGGAEGPLEIEVYAGPTAVEVMVRDRGTGIKPRVPHTEETAGIGLAVMQALCERVDFRGSEETGTEVWMAFSTPNARVLDPVAQAVGELPVPADSQQATAVEITIAPAALAQTILPRLLGVLAARAHFTTDRLADAHLVADALAARAPRSIRGGRLSIAISVKPRELELCIAPLRAGQADQLILDSAVDGLGEVIVKLTTDRRVATVGSSDDEMLALSLVDRR